jgi:hypothetical protein
VISTNQSIKSNGRVTVCYSCLLNDCASCIENKFTVNFVAADTEKKSSEKKSSDAPPKKKKKIELSLREEIELEMQDGPGEPPTVSIK